MRGMTLAAGLARARKAAGVLARKEGAKRLARENLDGLSGMFFSRVSADKIHLPLASENLAMWIPC